MVLKVSNGGISGNLLSFVVNEFRSQKGLNELEIIQVDLIVADEKDPNVKLSSTFIRSHIK